jgi:hypothetical protein
MSNNLLIFFFVGIYEHALLLDIAGFDILGMESTVEEED